MQYPRNHMMTPRGHMSFLLFLFLSFERGRGEIGAMPTNTAIKKSSQNCLIYNTLLLLLFPALVFSFWVLKGAWADLLVLDLGWDEIGQDARFSK